MNTPCNINQPHCNNCGSTSEEEVGYDARRRNEGYSECCNDSINYDNRSCRHNHK